VCNLDCAFCPGTSRKAGFMDLAMFEKILNDVKPFSRFLFFHVMGEPLLHPEIDKFLDISDKYGFKVNITTNGTVIEEAKGKILGKPALRLVNFSLHILDEKEEKEADEYLKNVFAFIDDVKGTGTIVCLRLWNIEQKEKRKAARNEYVLNVIKRQFKLEADIEENPTDSNGIKIAENVYVNQATCFDWPDININDLSDKGFCLGLRDQAAILVDGTVVPCCLDSEGAMALGNINKKPFSEIIEGPRAKEIYKGFSERKAVEALCRKCGYRERFGLE